MFDWLQFLQQRSIEYVTQGNVSGGWIAIACPFCGDDPSHHLGIDVAGRGGYSCWRNAAHKGRHPARLIQALLSCSWSEAQRISGAESHVILPDDFARLVRTKLEPLMVEERVLTVPREFRSFGPRAPLVIETYLARRNIPRKIIRTLTERFGMYYCTTGAYKGRIIFLVRYQRRLMGWTGRSVYAVEPLRYKTLSTNAERAQAEGFEPALSPVNHHLLFHDDLMVTPAHSIILTEGPFDALNLMLMADKLPGYCATCFFTLSVSEQQLALLHGLLPRFVHRYLLLDRGATAQALRLQSRLVGLGLQILELPDGVKDPGELVFPQFASLLENRA